MLILAPWRVACCCELHYPKATGSYLYCRSAVQSIIKMQMAQRGSQPHNTCRMDDRKISTAIDECTAYGSRWTSAAKTLHNESSCRCKPETVAPDPAGSTQTDCLKLDVGRGTGPQVQAHAHSLIKYIRSLP
jgi:hypothetical protein